MNTQTNHHSPLDRLIRDAKAAGYTVNTDSPTRVHIYKADRWGNIRTGIAITRTETGAFHNALRTDVRVDLAQSVRTIKVVRHILGLED